MMKGLYFSMILLVFLSPAKAQDPPTWVADELEQILLTALPSGQNSGAIMGVYVPGEWSWYGAVGKANRNDHYTMAEADFKFRIGSITKSFGVVCVMKLVEAGYLSLEDNISTYLRPTIIADTIPNGDQITVRQLLNHTSGVGELADNYTCMMDVMGNMDQPRSLEEAIACGSSVGPYFDPGTDFDYSNTNYSLVAMLIEEVSGRSYEEFVLDSIITPLGLTNTEIPENPEITGDHMGCWWPSYSADMTVIHSTVYKGWAGIVSNTEDLITYYEALNSGELISEASLDEMFSITGAAVSYGLGVEMSGDEGDSYHGHSGEVANTSGWYYSSKQTDALPNGYYICYNFNYQGVYLNTIDQPVNNLLTGISTDTKELSSKKDLCFYPNPADDKVHVENVLNSVISIYDISGTQVLELASSQLRCELDVSTLASGTYILEVMGETISRHKLIIQ